MNRSALPLALALAITAAPALAADAGKGAKVAKLCVACHSLTDATNKTGPSLRGVVGRAIASVAGFAYSEPMKAYAAKDKVWDEAKLNAYLANPKAIVPAGTMAFAGVKKAADRENLVEYLKTLVP